MAKEGQGDVAKAIADTRLLVEGSVSITDDLSQFDTDLTATGSGAFESPSSRTAIRDVRTIEITADLDNVTGGTLISHGDTGDTFHGYRLRVATSGATTIICSTSKEGTIFSETGPWFTGAVSSTLIVWAVYEDPEVLGRLRHELTVHNLDAVDDDDWLIAFASTDKDNVDPTDDLAIGGRWNGATLSDPFAHSIDFVRVSVAFHSAEEAKQAFVAQTAAPVKAAEDYTQRLPIPFTTNLGDDDEFAGWQYLYSNSAHFQNSRRLLSPIWNMVSPDPVELQDDIEDVFGGPDAGGVNPAWVHNIPLSDGFQTSIAWWTWRQIPNVCNRLHVRVHVQLWDSLGGAPDKIEVRMYSADASPESFIVATSIFSITGTRLTNDGVAGLGGWVDLGELQISRDVDRGK